MNASHSYESDGSEGLSLAGVDVAHCTDYGENVVFPHLTHVRATRASASVLRKPLTRRRVRVRVRNQVSCRGLWWRAFPLPLAFT